MRFSATATVALASAAGVLAANTTVKVGDNGLTFSPSSINATEGDFVIFQFVGGKHSATQSTFDDPCAKKADGVDSGIQEVGAAPIEWPVQINGTDALWFYCAQTSPVSHCQKGMVFAVNAPADKSFDAFQSKANSTATGNGTSTNGTSASPTASGPGASQTGSGAMSMSASAVSLLSVAGLALGLAL